MIELEEQLAHELLLLHLQESFAILTLPQVLISILFEVVKAITS